MSLVDRLLSHRQAHTRPLQEQTTPQEVADTRQYLADSAYQLPKDAQKDDRLNFQHHALFHAMGNHYLAPLHSPLLTVLDVGSGTGIWAAEIARLFPESVVVGLDLAATSFKQPLPPNCLLRLGNVLTGLPFPDAFFSYTHQRLLVAGITAEHWPAVVRELVCVTLPGAGSNWWKSISRCSRVDLRRSAYKN